MESIYQSQIGTQADVCFQTASDQFDEEYQALVTSQETAYGTSSLRPGEKYNVKTGPSFGGRESFWQYEIDVADWLDVTQLPKEQRGPELRNRLYGDASLYKHELEREKLKEDDGPKYLLEKLRPHFLKGKSTVFLHRLLQYFTLKRGSDDMQTWLARFALFRKKYDFHLKSPKIHINST